MKVEQITKKQRAKHSWEICKHKHRREHLLVHMQITRTAWLCWLGGEGPGWRRVVAVAATTVHSHSASPPSEAGHIRGHCSSWESLATISGRIEMSPAQLSLFNEGPYLFKGGSETSVWTKKGSCCKMDYPLDGFYFSYCRLENIKTVQQKDWTRTSDWSEG